MKKAKFAEDIHTAIFQALIDINEAKGTETKEQAAKKAVEMIEKGATGERVLYELEKMID